MAENQTTALATIAPTDANVGATFCSIKPTGDRKSDARIFSALNNPDKRIAAYINKKIAVTDILVEIREILNEETGIVEVVPRVVLIDEDGVSYQATSKGVFTAVQNAFRVFGDAPWNPPLVIEVKQQAVKAGSMLTFDVVG